MSRTRGPSSHLAIVAIIPARYGSTRLPGKPLSQIHGKPMIQHVHERVSLARRLDRVVVATDDARIADAVRGFGGEAMMTSPDHPTGTDRLAEAVASTEAAVVVNVQGDEPMLEPAWIDAALAPVLEDQGVEMATLSVPTRSGASRGMADRWSGLLPPPSRKEPLLATASMTGCGATIQVQRHPG